MPEPARPDGTSYALRGGVAGRERLRILARTLQASTAALFERLGVGAELRCLDAGCGGGDVTCELARRVGPRGRVLGVDVDAAKLELARAEAATQGLSNVEFRRLDLRTQALGADFDLIYCRFVLSHLADPGGTVAACYRAVRPGGLLIVEDIDFRGSFAWPERDAFQRYGALYEAVVRRRGGDPHIGARLPMLLRDGGFGQVGMHIVQPMATEGETKLIHPMTLESIGDAIVQDRLLARDELDALLRELYAVADDPLSMFGLPRIVQVWGQRPLADNGAWAQHSPDEAMRGDDRRA